MMNKLIRQSFFSFHSFKPHRLHSPLTSTSFPTLLPTFNSSLNFFSHKLLSTDKSKSGNDDDSHPDFQTTHKIDTKSKTSIQSFLKDAVESHDVLLFMKGTPSAPQCGFSARVVGVLQKQGVDFSSADVLSSPELRQGIKDFSNWPTVPQLFVQGKFVGGCDIVTEMNENGELAELLAPVIKNQKEQKKKENNSNS